MVEQKLLAKYDRFNTWVYLCSFMKPFYGILRHLGRHKCTRTKGNVK